MRTLNQQVKILSDFASAHQQINSFGSGQLEDFATSGVTTCMAMWVDFEPLTIDDSSETTVLRIYLLDRQQKGQENLNDALSDSIEVAKDLIAYLKAPVTFYDLILDYPIILNPVFESKVDDELAGVWFDINLRQAQLENRCQIPFTAGFVTPSPPSTSMVTVDKEVPSGTKNSSNKVFNTISGVPRAGTEYVYLNGQLLTNGVDYTISGTTITMTIAPDSTDTLYVTYRI